MAHKIHVGPPPVPLHNLSGGAAVVHGVSRHDVMTVRRPATPQHVGGATALKNTWYNNDMIWGYLQGEKTSVCRSLQNALFNMVKSMFNVDAF